MRLDSLSSTEFKRIMEGRPIVFLPIGGRKSFIHRHCAPTPCSRSSCRRRRGEVERLGRYPCAMHSTYLQHAGHIDLGFETTIRVVYDILMTISTARTSWWSSAAMPGSHMNALRQACGGGRETG